MFEHLKKNVVVPKHNELATWKPPSWVSLNGQPPPELHCIRITETSVRYARAQLNPRLPQVKQRRDGLVLEKDLVNRRERLILLSIISSAVGWACVLDADNKAVPFVKVGEEMTDPGVVAVRELLRMLGPDAEVSFVAFCNDHDNWVVEDADEDKEPAIPLH